MHPGLRVERWFELKEAGTQSVFGQILLELTYFSTLPPATLSTSVTSAISAATSDSDNLNTSNAEIQKGGASTHNKNQSFVMNKTESSHANQTVPLKRISDALHDVQAQSDIVVEADTGNI